MKASLITGVGRGFTTHEVSIAAPIGHEVLIDVRASGLCHTDRTIAMNDMGFPMPVLSGHEVAGVVSEVGPRVTGFKAGDPVVACLIQSCGRCARCLGGKPYQCTNPDRLGRDAQAESRLSIDGTPVFQAFGLGGFAEQALIHENQLLALPEWMPFDKACLLGCGVVTGVGAVLNAADVKVGESVVILGAGGGVGLNAVSGARLAGASRIVAVDVNGTRLTKAASFGASDLVNAAEYDAVDSVLDLLPGGADHVFDFVGTNAVAAQAMSMLGFGGTFYVLGVADAAAAVSVNLVTAVMRQISVVGVNTGASNPLRDIPTYMELYRQGRLNLDDLVSKEIALDEVEAAYAELSDPGISRIVITSF